MTKFSHRWLVSDSKIIENQMMFPYCQQPDASLDHDYFLTCLESEERKDVRIKSVQLLLD